MATIKGQNLRMFLDDDYAVAAATSCQVHLQMEASESSTKDTDSDWQDNEVTGMSWDCQADALVVEKPEGDGSAAYLDDFQYYMENREPVKVSFGMAGGTKNRAQQGMLLEGNAFITDLQITAQNRQNSVVSVKLQGVGELSIVPYAAPSFQLPIQVKDLTTSDYILLNQEMSVADITGMMEITDSTHRVLTLTGVSSTSFTVKYENTVLFALTMDSNDGRKLNIAGITTGQYALVEIVSIQMNNE